MARVTPIFKLTLRQMMFDPSYHALADDLRNFPVPDTIRISRRRWPVPLNFTTFSKSICYGQRLFMTSEENNDFGAIFRIMDGYYHPIVTGEKWDEDDAIVFGKNILNCKVFELYPVVMLLINYMAELVKREQRLLQRELKKIERAAGVEKLAPYSELISLDFLRDVMKITIPEVLQTPYNECLVRFMLNKEIEDYRERYAELSRIESESNNKKNGRKA